MMCRQLCYRHSPEYLPDVFRLIWWMLSNVLSVTTRAGTCGRKTFSVVTFRSSCVSFGGGSPRSVCLVCGVSVSIVSRGQWVLISSVVNTFVVCWWGPPVFSSSSGSRSECVVCWRITSLNVRGVTVSLYATRYSRAGQFRLMCVVSLQYKQGSSWPSYVTKAL
jgi:hypothetical protein